jgi:hypothetical protein
MKINFFKVNTLPATLEADSFYYVLNGTRAESYLTDNAGSAKLIGNTQMINDLINQALGGLNLDALEIVADIAARDAAQAGYASNKLVLVTDATADATVNAGAALYAYNNADDSFTKVSEYESLDIQLEWSQIQNRPLSTVSQIDDAVAKRHTHANKAVLDLVTEDADLDLEFRGNPVLKFKTANW